MLDKWQKIKECVYIGYDQKGLFKIGMTNNWQRRAKEIQNMNPNFEMLTMIPTDKPAVLEATLHEAYSHKRVVGEWFELSAEDIQNILEKYSPYKPTVDEVYSFWKFAAGGGAK